MERSIAQLSGGEKKRVALALGLGFAEVVAARGRLTSNILVLDEVCCAVLGWDTVTPDQWLCRMQLMLDLESLRMQQTTFVDLCAQGLRLVLQCT
jgi:ABC-type nitrate/sulfonate/bicarbonate transport system ATPase subunit